MMDLKTELQVCFIELEKAIDSFRKKAIELGNEKMISIDPNYHKLIITKANLLIELNKLG